MRAPGSPRPPRKRSPRSETPNVELGIRRCPCRSRPGDPGDLAGDCDLAADLAGDCDLAGAAPIAASGQGVVPGMLVMLAAELAAVELELDLEGVSVVRD